jgi:oligopeptide transport system substrate-binding protein
MRWFFLICVLFASCHSSTQKSEPRLHINIGADPQTLDPRKARDLGTITLVRMAFEGLTRSSKSGELELALAESVERSEDWTRFVFHLRKSFWSNGEALTSADFAESWKSILDPRFPTDIAYQLYVIKNGRKVKQGEIDSSAIGIQTPDPQTLIVELEQPTPYFLELVSMSSFFPVPSRIAADNPNWALNPETHIGNGPFKIELWNHGDLIRIAKNPKYWQADDVKIAGIDLYMLSGDTEMRMFEEGKIDWAGAPLASLPTDALANLKKQGKLQKNPLSGTYFFRVNVSESVKNRKNPLCNASFRKALAYALNRKEIAEHILQGGQKSAQALVPPEMNLSESGYFADAQIDLARDCLNTALSELHLSRDSLEPIVLSYKNTERNTSIVQAIQKQWEMALSIPVQLEAVDPKILYRLLSQKEYQIAASDWVADFNDPINFLEVFKYKDASTNNTNWESPKYVDLLNRSAISKNADERREIMREAESILMDQMPIIPVFHYTLNYLKKEGLKEVVLSPIGQIDFRWAQSQ